VILTFREYGPPVEMSLPEPVATSLAASGLVDISLVGPARYRLQPGDRVGAVRVGDHEVIVEPKIGPLRLFFLLGYAKDPGFQPDEIEGLESSDLLPILAESLARQVERATRRGVLQGYVRVDEALPLVRGRIRTADQMARRPAMLLPVEVTYDEFSVDIAENRIVRTAVRRMMNVPRVRSEALRLLGHLDGRLDGVTPLIPGQPIPSWLSSRLNGRYIPALRISEIVLRHLSSEIGRGAVPMASFVVDLAKVFEDFVTTALQEATADRPGQTIGQYSVSLDRAGRVRMYPDVVHVAGGRALAVFDAKYKLEGDSRGIPNADVYQMLAYCTALGLRRGYLVYAKGEGEPLTHHIANVDPPVEIVQCPLDLNVPPADLLAQIDRLAETALGPASASYVA
jgi:5-methylcytosine-specific restriction enzyme subunit McrC